MELKRAGMSLLDIAPVATEIMSGKRVRLREETGDMKREPKKRFSKSELHVVERDAREVVDDDNDLFGDEPDIGQYGAQARTSKRCERCHNHSQQMLLFKFPRDVSIYLCEDCGIQCAGRLLKGLEELLNLSIERKGQLFYLDGRYELVRAFNDGNSDDGGVAVEEPVLTR